MGLGRASLVAALGLAVAGSAACAEIIGLGPFGEGGHGDGPGGAGGAATTSSRATGGGDAGSHADASSVASGGGGDGTGPCAHPCAATVDGWEGPFEYVVDPAGCDAGWELENDVFSEPAARTCGSCGCAVPADVCVASIGTFTDNNCLTPAMVGFTVPEGCTPRTVNGVFIRADGIPSNTTCDAVPIASCTKPSVERAGLCRPSASGSCTPSDHQKCVAPVPAGQLCVSRVADGTTCPSAYPNQAKPIYDDYALSVCKCGAVTNFDCNPTVLGYDPAGNGCGMIVDIQPGLCHSFLGTNIHAFEYAALDTGRCDDLPQVDLMPGTELTVCCR